ncbi:ABC transporter permease [Sulfobacillus harzensis]|uniref:ABC transporter permease n=1 Tax=Sulfobacillus harzensis TaxID=2729629 RepID=A0A7Y0L081_9FIRM|nr:ABC transporter permease [Sulfobacillus harzensis]NMP20862.1 ABC transporter permease [Sulfobacillus harzensis]
MSEPRPRSRRHRPRLTRDWRFWTGVGIFMFMLAFTYLGPLIYRQNPLLIHVNLMDQPPSLSFPLGTDNLGRSELARVMWGGQMILIVSLASTVGATLIGLAVGWASALGGRWADALGTWVTDIVLSVPQLVPILLIMNLYRLNTQALIAVVGLTSWPLVARIVRAQTLSIKERPYIEAAQSLGAGPLGLAGRHVLPNMGGTLLVALSNCLGATVLVVATASFFGFSLPPPAPNWATMIAYSSNAVFDGYWWLMIFPGLALVLVELSANLVADATHDVLARQGGAS